MVFDGWDRGGDYGVGWLGGMGDGECIFIGLNGLIG